jgi:hypothetical protein
MAQKRKRVRTATLVASTNPLMHILSKRLEILVRYVPGGITHEAVTYSVIGINEYPYRRI